MLAHARGLLDSEVIGPTVRTQARLITSVLSGLSGLCMQAKNRIAHARLAACRWRGLRCVALRCVALHCVAAGPVHRLFSMAGKSCFHSSGLAQKRPRTERSSGVSASWTADLGASPGPSSTFCISRIPDRGHPLHRFDAGLQPPLGLGLLKSTGGPEFSHQPPSSSTSRYCRHCLFFPFPPIQLPALFPPSTSPMWTCFGSVLLF